MCVSEDKECVWSYIHLLWLFRLHLQISLSHRGLWQILWRVIPRGCVLRQHVICGHGSGLWRSFTKWLAGTCFVMVPVGFVSGVW